MHYQYHPKKNSISVGYNNGGKDFFDLLYEYKKYIHSYYFSLTEFYNGELINTEEAIKSLYTDTYKIPGNLLLNTDRSMKNYKELIEKAININTIDLEGVTIIDIDYANKIKKEFPFLLIHLSVRSMDINKYKEKINGIDSYIGLIDVINISGAYHFNNFEYVNKLKQLGFKTKFIVNEGCIINREKNYTNFPLFHNASCRLLKFNKNETKNTICSRICKKVQKEYPWMNLCVIDVYKEEVEYYNYDILKISTRMDSLDDIKNRLEYWTSSNPSTHFFKKIDDNIIPIFEEYVQNRRNCNKDCYNCRKCETTRNKLINETGDWIERC